MGVLYYSTRGDKKAYTASQAILQGLARDGGLFVPNQIPVLDKTMKELSMMDYQQVAYEVMKLFLTDYTPDELKSCIKNAYSDRFDTQSIAPTAEKAGAYYLELFHGPTIAFKDMALSILPHLMVTAAKKNNCSNEIVILTATSGDTGKAAMAGFADVSGTRIVVFYPKGGVSAVQEKQMVTQKGKNVKVVGIHGNFDDAQSRVKQMFGDKALEEILSEKGFQLSSANSINIGRLVPQIVYYVYAYACMLRDGKLHDEEKINVVVPTGNFGNILAAYYAKNMGVPIKTLVCASNDNKVLYDFFRNGKYDRNRDFILTTSPSMDILISSNLERLIYKMTKNDSDKTAKLMKELSENGSYSITKEMAEQAADFYGNYANEAETAERIKHVYESDGYIMDTHTAVASAVYEKYKTETGDDTKTLIASTASPYKFVRSVMSAIDSKYENSEDFALIDELKRISGVKIPDAVEQIRSAQILHDTVADKDDMKKTVMEFLGV